MPDIKKATLKNEYEHRCIRCGKIIKFCCWLASGLCPGCVNFSDEED